MGGRNTAIEIIDHFSGMFDFSLSENKIMKEPHNDWFPGFDKQLTVLSFGMVKDLEKCIQCGKCTAQCPAAKLSPYNPRKIINDIRTGNIGKVISSEELWLCFFCSGCYAVCPNDINFPFAVTMLRYAALAKGYGWDEVRKIRETLVFRKPLQKIPERTGKLAVSE